MSDPPDVLDEPVLGDAVSSGAPEGQADVVIIGPSTVGKTSMMASLQQAARIYAKENPNIENPIEVRPASDAMADLFKECLEVITLGRLPYSSTIKTVRYVFKVFATQVVDEQVKESRWWGGGRVMKIARRVPVERSFVFLDGPGGSVFPESGKEDADRKESDRHREETIREMEHATSLILCLDPGDIGKVATVFINLVNLLNELPRRLPFRNVTLCFTKADRYFSAHGKTALKALRTANIREILKRAMGETGFVTLKNALDKNATLAVGWTSAYGFVMNEDIGYGMPNFDDVNKRLLVFDGYRTDEVIDTWRPFQVLDPLLLVTTGEPHGFLKLSLRKRV